MVHAAKAGAGGPLRPGLVGVGVMGANQARVLADLADVKLVGIADPDQKQRSIVLNSERSGPVEVRNRVPDRRLGLSWTGASWRRQRSWGSR
jgi:predicted homoserine dehydrogenase-like protein